MRRLLRAAAGDRLARRDPRAQAEGRWCSPAGPASVYEPGAPAFPTGLLDLEIPMLGICYGMQAMVQALGGKVEEAESGEFGRAELTLTDGGGRLLGGLPEEQSCWMSHRDTVFEPPPGFDALASTPGLAGRRLRGTRPGPLRDPVPPRGRPHALRHRDPHPLPARHRRLRAAVVARVGDRRAGCPDPGAGGGGHGHLRPLRRGRLLGRGAARPQGGGGEADLRLRRPRPDADERGRAGGRGLRAVRDPARPRRSGGALPGEAGRVRTTPRPSARSSARSSSASSRRRRRSSRTPAIWSRAPSIPT